MQKIKKKQWRKLISFATTRGGGIINEKNANFWKKKHFIKPFYS
jgi:hypothetical protein